MAIPSDLNGREHQKFLSGTISGTTVPVIASAIQLIDNGGTIFGVKQINNKPRVSAMPYLFDIAEGNVSGHATWTKIGYNPTVGGTEEDIWTAGGVYIPPSAEMALEFISSSTADTSNGIGVRTMTLYYLDDAFTEKTEVITLSGTTPGTTAATDIFRINALRVTTTGTSKSAVGTIDVRNLTDTPVYTRILPGYTQARNSHYTVPKDKTLYITSITLSSGAAVAGRSVRMTTRASYDSAAGTKRDFFFPYTEVIVQDNSFTRELEIPTKLVSGVDIKVSAISPDGDTYCSCALRGWLETE